MVSMLALLGSLHWFWPALREDVSGNRSLVYSQFCGCGFVFFPGRSVDYTHSLFTAFVDDLPTDSWKTLNGLW